MVRSFSRTHVRTLTLTPPHRRKWHENNKAEYNAKRRKAARIKAAEKRLAATRPNHRAVSAQPKVKRVKTLHESPLCPLLLPLPLPPVPSSIIIPNSSSLGAGLLKLYSSPCFAMGAMRMMAPPPPVAMMAMAAMTPTGMMPFTTAAMPFVDFNRY
ncbi:hypothetical protein BASA81_008036 [Batrachochytrium salamandrivorans]|nr:hypothetical protein BASA81_008036 [Batrachochytrium salamandrivorans]